MKEPDVERCLNWYRTRLEAEHVVKNHALRVQVPPVPFCRDGSTGTASVLKTDMSGEIPAIRVQIPVTAFIMPPWSNWLMTPAPQVGNDSSSLSGRTLQTYFNG